MPRAETIDEYIAGFPEEIREILERIRDTIRGVAPEAEESISYQIPTFSKERNRIHFAAFKSHIGLYPPVTGDARLVRAVAKYANEKGNLRFPLSEPIPYPLIAKIAKQMFRDATAKRSTRMDKRD